jgi:hypothetical protein
MDDSVKHASSERAAKEFFIRLRPSRRKNPNELATSVILQHSFLENIPEF